MTDPATPQLSEVPPAIPPIVLPPPQDQKRSGVLKWGLLGCAGASVVVIAGLVFLMSNARSMMGWALTKLQDGVMMACTPDVTPEERTEFRQAFQRFTVGTKEGRVTPTQVEEIQKEVTAAIGDGRVTPEEIRDLTAALKKAVP